MPGGMIGDARKRLAGTRGTGLPGYFIAPDAHDEPTIWRGKPDDDTPVAVLRRCQVADRAFWAAVVAMVEGGVR